MIFQKNLLSNTGSWGSELPVPGSIQAETDWQLLMGIVEVITDFIILEGELDDPVSLRLSDSIILG